MIERPIVFSTSQVIALLDGRKTQTRFLPAMRNCAVNGRSAFIEKFLWRHLDWSDAFVDPGPSPAGNVGPYWKVAFGGVDESGDGYEGTRHRIYPLFFPGQRLWVREALHMPRQASRITLTVTEVRLERLQEISHGDLAAEGLTRDDSVAPGQLRGDFARFWDRYHRRGATSWAANPWVIALSFSVMLRNIDSAIPQ
jgi:hypothetical protein